MTTNHQPPAPTANPPTDSPALSRPRPSAGWDALDSDYGPRGEDSPQDKTMPVSGFSWRFMRTGEPPDDLRVRAAMPLLFLWVMLSGFLHGVVPWLVLGFLLAAYAVTTLPRFRRYGLAGRGWALAGVGVGEMLLGGALALNLSLFWSLVGLYWAVLLGGWIVMELRGIGKIWG